MKIPTMSDRYKLERLIKEAGFSRSSLAKAIGVSYKTVYRWLDKGVLPQLNQSRDIDVLFKEYVDISDWVHDLKKQIVSPLKTIKADKKIRERFFLLMTYHSDGIEGSRMTLKETEQAIAGEKVKGKGFFEILEAINHYNAMQYMLDAIHPNFMITEEFLLKVHSIIMYGFGNKLPGKYRTGHVNLTNTEKALPSFQQVPIKMKQLIKEVNDHEGDLIKKVSRDHYEFESIHPFFDGNGRVGRILMNTQLLSQGYPPAIIEVEDRYKYYLALSKGDMGEFKNLVQMVCDSVLKGYDLLFV